jgi:hypothetical protein
MTIENIKSAQARRIANLVQAQAEKEGVKIQPHQVEAISREFGRLAADFRLSDNAEIVFDADGLADFKDKKVQTRAPEFIKDLVRWEESCRKFVKKNTGMFVEWWTVLRLGVKPSVMDWLKQTATPETPAES